MISALRSIYRGMGYVSGYGDHPGTPILVFLVVLGMIAGMGRSENQFSITNVLLGGGVMLLVFGPVYLYGAYERGRK